MVSVIVPVFNVEPYLDRCIQSIVDQSFQNIEIILVDDGSTDSSPKICDAWKQRDSRIIVIHKKNGGLSDARNTGINASQGEKLCFIDSDDWIEPNYIELLDCVMTKYTAEIAVCNYIREVSSEDYVNSEKRIASGKDQFIEEHVFTGRDFLSHIYMGKYVTCVIACNKLFRRELFDSICYPVGKLHEDEYVIHRLVYSCKRVVCIPNIGYHYWQRADGIMGRSSVQRDAPFLMEAYSDRCRFFIDRGEQFLAVKSERQLLHWIKKAQESLPKERMKYQLELFHMSADMYRRHWLSFKTLVKRFIRCYFL